MEIVDFLMDKGYLFVLSGNGSVIGGHLISSLSLATTFHQRGSRVGVMMSPFRMDVPDINFASFNFYPVVPSHSYFFTLLKRTCMITKIISSGQYSALVAADHESAVFALPALILSGIPLIQINANEKVPHYPPLYIPGIIVFSDSVFWGYKRQFGIPEEYMYISSGRINFNYFASGSFTGKKNQIFSRKGRKILAVSRLVRNKVPSFVNLFKEFRQIGDREIVQLVIIGGGESQASLEQSAAEILPYLHPESSITFTGPFRVTPGVLKQAEIVVGQGRTVIEAIASGVPAAVSGEDGYKGLITPENFLDFRKTDFSGRLITTGNTFENDLNRLPYFQENDLDIVYKIAKEHYDAEIGVKAIEMLCAKFKQLYPSSFSRRWAYICAFAYYFWYRFWYYFKKIGRKLTMFLLISK